MKRLVALPLAALLLALALAGRPQPDPTGSAGASLARASAASPRDAEIASRAAVEPLEGATSSADSQRRPSRPTGEALSARRSRSPSEETRTSPAGVPSGAAIPHLRDVILTGPDDGQARAATVALAQNGSDDAIRALLEILATRPTLQRAGDAGAALARTPGPASVDGLIGLARTGDEPDRLAALATIEMTLLWWRAEPPTAEAAISLDEAQSFLQSEGVRIAERIRDEGASPLTRAEAARLIQDIPLLW